jgi:hypothetical protein
LHNNNNNDTSLLEVIIAQDYFDSYHDDFYIQ